MLTPIRPASLITAILAISACTSQQSHLVTEQQSQKSFEQANEWVTIPAGEFLMGSSDSDNIASDNEKPQHLVKINKAFKMARHEVTFAEYERFATETQRALPSDSGFAKDDKNQLPVINVSWDDATAYAEWLSKVKNSHFRLPTEAEWEYAARAGTTSPYFWGDDANQACDFANVFDQRNQTAIRDRFSVPKAIAANFNCEDPYFAIAPVASFKANPWGLHDLLGNVWEWVQDCRHNDYKNAPTTATSAWETDHQGDCTKRGVRGGSWFVKTDYVRTANRSWNHPSDRGSGLGFRLVQD